MGDRAIPRVRSNAFRIPSTGGEPKVVVDAARDWAAVTRWQPSYLKRIVGDQEVRLREIAGPPVNIYQKPAGGGLIRFADYLDWMLEVDRDVTEMTKSLGKSPGRLGVAEAGELATQLRFAKSYYFNARLETLSPVLRNHVEVPDWLDTEIQAINLWCGVLGASCGLHCDLTPNCNVQIIGRKHFTLFSPDEGGLLYPVEGRTHCRFDPNLPDFDRFPAARRAERWHCTLQPGEALYIPVGWYHQTSITSGWAINLNVFWCRPFLHGLGTPGVWPHLLREMRARVLARLGASP